MGLPLWKKKRLIRRCTGTVGVDGYNVPAFEDFYILADVQTIDNSVSTGLDGDIGLQKIKAFTDCEMEIASENGNLGDRIWFQGKWFECRSSRLSENTFLKHWTNTFVECTNADVPPVKARVEGEKLVIEAPKDLIYADGTKIVFSKKSGAYVNGSTLSIGDDK